MGITINGNGAAPVFVEPDEYHNLDPDKIEAAITSRTKAILPVHLYGQACDMAAIMDIAKRHGLKVVEDCAQSHGARRIVTVKSAAEQSEVSFESTAGVWKTTGTFGDIGCFSFYPSKNLGAFGDGGAIVTDDDEIARQFRVFRNYGCEIPYQSKVEGANSRLDELQAAVLRTKLVHLDEMNAERHKICGRYLSGITNPLIKLPKIREGCETVWHQFVILSSRREELIDHLKQRGVGTIIHYPIPPHLHQCYKHLGHKKGYLPIAERYADEVLSLPLFNGMTDDEIDYVIKAANEFC
jgi:dTDP-4-amino-4,6-dideoxygalactose transaminase